MEKITSFTIDHLNLEPGVYTPREDMVGPETVTTFDLRVATPNKELVMSTTEVHTLERLGVTFLRNHADFDTRTLYFGSVGCRTDFYLLPRGGYEPVNILPLLCELFRSVTNSTGEVPGTTTRNCSNYPNMNLPMAKWEARRYLERAPNTPWPSQLRYPG